MSEKSGKMNDPALAFLHKIPDQCGYIVLLNGAIKASDGELANREVIAQVAEKMANVIGSNLIAGTKFTEMTVSYGTHLFNIVNSGNYTYVVKRRPAALVSP